MLSEKHLVTISNQMLSLPRGSNFSDGDVVILTGNAYSIGSLALYRQEQWKPILELFTLSDSDRHGKWTSEWRSLCRLVIGYAQECVVENGYIQIPANLMQFAELSQEAIWIQSEERVEIHNPTHIKGKENEDACKLSHLPIQLYPYSYKEIFSCADGTPFITCIVPTEWLAMPLPTMKGAIAYVGNQQEKVSSPKKIFEFVEISGVISLTIYTTKIVNGAAYWMKVGMPTTFRIHHLTEDDNEKTPIRLLHHLFAPWNVLSSVAPVCFLDFDDLIKMLTNTSEFIFYSSFGDDPQDILLSLLERLRGMDAKEVFVVLFAKRGSIKLSFVDQIVGAFSNLFPEANILLGDAAIQHKKILISVLVGR